MRHILDSPVRQVVVARGGADINTSVVGSVADGVAGEVAVNVDIANGVADVVAHRQPNKQLLLPNRYAFFLLLR